MNTRDRYSGIQTVLKSCGDEGCHFLTLLSIAEEESEKEIDLINAIHYCQQNGLIQDDFTVNRDGTAILNHYTNKRWSRREVKNLPAFIKENEYTEAIWERKYTSKGKEYTIRHYRRRGYDMLKCSKTVAEGKIVKYYIYTCN